MNLNQVTVPVIDMHEATAFYRKMGFLQIVDTHIMHGLQVSAAGVRFH